MSESKKPTGPGEMAKGEEKAGVTRRDFLSEVTLGALGIAGLGSALVTYQYFSPNVLFEPSMTFRAGNPDLYPVNSVTYLQEQEVYIVRAEQGFFAVSAICTHLGCITSWHPEHKLIECPCHGSKFRDDGVKVSGPAPAPLPHFSISLTTDGELLVNKLDTVKLNQALKV